MFMDFMGLDVAGISFSQRSAAAKVSQTVASSSRASDASGNALVYRTP